MAEFTETTTHARTVACRQCGAMDLSKDGYCGETQFFSGEAQSAGPSRPNGTAATDTLRTLSPMPPHARRQA